MPAAKRFKKGGGKNPGFKSGYKPGGSGGHGGYAGTKKKW
jgi:hypothetical protein